jgi:imidazole glycerol phosphate synthase glutamine amidotransferase subunit
MTRTPPEVLVVRTGIANLASVLAALRRAGALPRVTEDPAEVVDARFVEVPGVGAFGPAMERLAGTGLADAIAGRVSAGRPTLCVCLGLQVLCEGSDESPGTAGLGLVAGRATRFPPSVRVPQFGWNEVVPGAGCRVVEPGYAYFANSFRLVDRPAGWGVATSDHGGPFVAALERGNVVAAQFHPELSGAWGLDLLRRWIGGEGC